MAREGKLSASCGFSDGEIYVARKGVLDFDEIDAATMQHVHSARCLGRRINGNQEGHAKLWRQWPLEERPRDHEARPDHDSIADFLSQPQDVIERCAHVAN